MIGWQQSVTRRCLMRTVTVVVSEGGRGRAARPLAGLLQQRSHFYHELSYVNMGDPAEVLSYRRTDDVDDGDLVKQTTESSASAAAASQPEQQWVKIEMLAAPWNPADAMSVRGRYPSPYSSSSSSNQQQQQAAAAADQIRVSTFFQHADVATVAGSEGWGRVTEVSGPATEKEKDGTGMLQVGDYVVPGQPGLGTLRSSLSRLPADSLIRLDRGQELYDKVGAVHAAALFQTGGTALRMLQQGECNNNKGTVLQLGDVVVQNAGNSAVGFMVSQLATAMGLQPVSLVRRGSRSTEQFDALVLHLTQNGKNSLVVAEDDLLLLNDDSSSNSNRKDSTNALVSQLRELSDRQPRLALNAVGGPSASILLNLLGPSGTMITYGGMSSQPNVLVPTSHLIFRDLHLAGYWHSRWMAQQSTAPLRAALMNELVDAVLDGNLECPPVTAFPLSHYKEAFEFEAKQSGEAIRSKVVFDCRDTVPVR